MRSDIATRKQLVSHAKNILKHKPEKLYIDLAEISFAEYIEYHLCPDLIDEIERLKNHIEMQSDMMKGQGAEIERLKKRLDISEGAYKSKSSDLSLAQAEIERLKEVVRTQKSLTELAIKQLTNYGLTQLEINLNSMLEKLDSDYLDRSESKENND